VVPKELDSDPWLLNVENGTLDLRSGELREHHGEDLMTKLAPVCYVSGARAPVWKPFSSVSCPPRGFGGSCVGLSPSEAREEPQEGAQHRSWWRRVFGG
jgi:hypothetical protein